MALPIIGIILFSAASYHSLRRNQEIQRAPSRYFWWSAIRLDSDPANKRNWGATPCEGGKENCVGWDLRTIWVYPSLTEQFLMLSALPAFVVGEFAVRGLGRMGISQVSSFMFLMPVLIFAWYYLIGWLLESRLDVAARGCGGRGLYANSIVGRSGVKPCRDCAAGHDTHDILGAEIK